MCGNGALAFIQENYLSKFEKEDVGITVICSAKSIIVVKLLFLNEEEESVSGFVNFSVNKLRYLIMLCYNVIHRYEIFLGG